ncbi:alanine racemase [Pontimonas sp.]|nr:alanine racemase [Pontimonas sp.]
MGIAPTCWVSLSLPAFAGNIAHAKSTLAGKARLMVAVKSDAYGHGEKEIAETALRAGADSLAVLDIDSGVRLRPHAGDAMLLAWLLSPSDDFAAAARSRVDLGISGLWQLKKLAREVPEGCVSVHLKIDTGLHRNGALPGDWEALCTEALRLERAGILRVTALWSHLSDTSLKENELSLARFHEAVDQARTIGLTPELLHIAASAAATDLPESRLDLVRVGISAYGVSPFDDRSAHDMGFAPIMSAHAVVTSVDAERSEAHIGIGYAHGLLPLPPETGWVVHGTQRLELRSVEADHCVLALPSNYPLDLGDHVTLWGEPDTGSPSAEQWASWSGTIGDEVVSAMAHSIEHRFIRQ